MAGAATTTYTYDGDGRRTRADTGSASTMRDLLWDPLSPRVLAERDGTGATTSSFVYGNDPAAIVAGSAASSPITWLTTDQIDSIREARDASGAVVGSAAYEPYGVPRSTSGTLGEVGYASAPQSAPGGDLAFGARDYDPASATFTTPDGGGGSSPYGYANDDPAQNVDPTGDASSLGDEFLGAIHSLSGDVAGFSTSAAIFCLAACQEAEPFLGTLGAGAALVNGASGAILGVDNCEHGKGSCVDDLAEAAIGMGASRFGDAEPLAEEALALRNSTTEGKDLLASGWVAEESVAEGDAVALSRVDRVGAGLKGDPYHRSTSWVVNNPSAERFAIVGRDGVERKLYRLPGELDNKAGIFEWILDESGSRPVITHQRFIGGGRITGYPNQVP